MPAACKKFQQFQLEQKTEQYKNGAHQKSKQP